MTERLETFDQMMALVDDDQKDIRVIDGQPTELISLAGLHRILEVLDRSHDPRRHEFRRFVEWADKKNDERNGR